MRKMDNKTESKEHTDAWHELADAWMEAYEETHNNTNL